MSQDADRSRLVDAQSVGLSATKTALGDMLERASDSTRENTSPLTVHNFVVRVDTQCTISLETLVLRAKNVEYDPQRHTSAILRIRQPRATALVFRSGKLISFPVKFGSFRVTNVICAAHFGAPVWLQGLAYDRPSDASYEPELSPALQLRTRNPSSNALVFASGKCVITGVRSLAEAEVVWRKRLRPALAQYRRKRELGDSAARALVGDAAQDETADGSGVKNEPQEAETFALQPSRIRR
ncbi:MAG: hypothetical protein MHM6MM_004377 [Cercozoa sp. M6MM]